MVMGSAALAEAAPVWQSETGGTGTASSAAIATPSGTSNGDLLFLHVGFEKGDDIVEVISQFTKVRCDYEMVNIGQG